MIKLIKKLRTSKEVKNRSKHIKKIQEEKRIDKLNTEFNKLYDWINTNIDSVNITKEYNRENNDHSKTLKTIYKCNFDKDNIRVVNTFFIGVTHNQFTSIYLNDSSYQTLEVNSVKMFNLLNSKYETTQKNKITGVDSFLKRINDET